MIKVFIDNYKDIADWFLEKILQKVFGKKKEVIAKLKSYNVNNSNHKILIKLLVNSFACLSKEDVGNFLTLPLDGLKIKYRFIKEYVHLIDSIYKSKTKHISANKQFIGFVNNSFKLMFDYKFIPLEVKRELVNKFNIRICPYCNRQFIQPLTINNVYRYICDLDHIKPKMKYPLFSMSLWNLLPCCKPCNQSFKNQDDTEILSPYDSGFDDDVIFKIDFKDSDSVVGLSENMDFRWEYSNKIKNSKKKLCQNNIALFHLNEVYSTNKREIMNILRKKYNLSKSYDNSLARFEDLKFLLDERTYYGVSLDPREFQNEILSKAIYDVIYHN